MSFEFPFTNPKGWSLQKSIFAGIILVHAIWIVVHLNLVSQGLINPWKLGGYGMYTTAIPKPRLHVFDRQFQGVEVPLSKQTYYNFRLRNQNFSFQCEPMTEKSLLGFFEENPNLVGHTLRFFVSQRKFLRNPIRAKRRAHAMLEVVWKEAQLLEYTGQVCGKIYEGQLNLPKQ